MAVGRVLRHALLIYFFQYVSGSIPALYVGLDLTQSVDTLLLVKCIGLAAITGIPNEVLRRTWHLPFLDQPQQLFLADGAHYSTSSFIQAVYYNIQKPP
jgi:hypothetical protein